MLLLTYLNIKGVDKMTEENKKMVISSKGKKQIDSLNYDELLAFSNRVMDTDTLSKEEKKPIIVYAHKQLEKLLKRKEYEDKSISDADFISKWGSK